MSDLIERIASEYRDFDFFQLVSLLEEYFRARGINADPIAGGNVRFTADDSIGFPASDIAGVDASSERVWLLLAFMGLIGTTSPLPNYFIDYAVRCEKSGGALHDFLAMFNHRVYTLFFQAWRKYRFISLASAQDFVDRVRQLAGQTGGDSGAQAGEALPLCSYAGILGLKARSGRGLEALLSDYFGDIPVTVLQCRPRWAPLPSHQRIGVDAQLGVSLIVGTHVYDTGGKFKVQLGPLPRPVFTSFLPGTPQSRELSRLVAQYCSDPLEYEIEILLQSQELEAVVLGAPAASLGKTASLGRSRQKSGVESVVYS
jgi:type VI secretion system protein ImpH